MDSTTRRRVLVRSTPAALAVALLLVAAGCGGSKGQSGPIEQYVAMGDSYAAGPGIRPVADAGCARSGANYGSLIAKALKVSDYSDVTCNGATTENLVTSQTAGGVTINGPQLDSLNENTDLVTLGIGLNDGGFSVYVLYLCLPQAHLQAQCAAYLAQPESVLAEAVAKIASNVKDSLASIRKQAPHARIVLIGYPRGLPDGAGCTKELDLTGMAADRTRQALADTDRAYAKVAAQEKVAYVSMYRASAGHDLCSSSPWTNGETDRSESGQGAALHPRPVFMRQVAQRVEALLEK